MGESRCRFRGSPPGWLGPAQCGTHEAQPALCTHAVQELENTIRRWLWLHHGHEGQYGDDGEMQCANCLQHGAMDYKRDSVERLLDVAGRANNILADEVRRLREVVEAVKLMINDHDSCFLKTDYFTGAVRAALDRLEKKG